MYSKLSTYILFTCLFLISTFITQGQSKQTTAIKPNASTIQVIQFHTNHRCMTCNLIEKLARETVKEHFPSITFRLVNVDDPKNEKIAEEFEATGTALFIYNPMTKKKKDLTDFAFMNAKSDANAFKSGVKKEITDFSKK